MSDQKDLEKQAKKIINSQVKEAESSSVLSTIFKWLNIVGIIKNLVKK